MAKQYNDPFIIILKSDAFHEKPDGELLYCIVYDGYLYKRNADHRTGG
ncbi:hypothetical protein [Ileibacterium valens]